MSLMDFRTWSERQQILGLIIGTLALIVGLLYFVLWPRYAERRELEAGIESKRNQLAAAGLLMDEARLERQKEIEEEQRDKLMDEWARMVDRLGGFPNPKELAHDQVAKIDYKVELLNARDALQEASRQASVDLPYELGMVDTVLSSEDTRQLMLQLRCVKKMADLLVGLDIEELGRIQPLPPILHPLPGTELSYFEEYPLQMEFYGSLENVYALFAAIMKSEHVFFLKNLRVESASFETPDLLRVNATASALLLFKDPDDLPPVRAAARETPRVRPRY